MLLANKSSVIGTVFPFVVVVVVVVDPLDLFPPFSGALISGSVLALFLVLQLSFDNNVLVFLCLSLSLI